MTLAPHQQRVVDEERELRVKVDALLKFSATSTYQALGQDEMKRLNRQFFAMSDYLRVLVERIDAF